MRPRLPVFLLRRASTALLLVLVASSAALLLARLAPGDHLSPFDLSPETIAAERRRLCLDCPLYQQYFAWLAHLARFDLGTSTMYPGRGVGELLVERSGRTAVIGLGALLLATAIGIPLGIVTGSQGNRPAALVARSVSLLLLAMPPVVLSLVLLLVASRTGWFPVGGLPEGRGLLDDLRYVVLPVTALALPMAAVLERLQSRALARALSDPSILAARARGLSRSRVIWRHALRLSLPPVLAVYGLVVGSLLGGSFVVEYVMTWPGLGRLMYDALVARDANVVAGCAAAGAACLAAGVFAADVALAFVDPRLGEAP